MVFCSLIASSAIRAFISALKLRRCLDFISAPFPRQRFYTLLTGPNFGEHLNLRARPRKINRVRADAAPDFQNFLPAPAFELRKSRNVIFDEVLARLDLVKIFFRANRRGRVPDVAGTAVPVIPDARDFHIAEIHAHRLAKKNAASNCPITRNQSDSPFNDPVSARTPQGTLQSCRQKVSRRLQAKLMNRPRIWRTICNP